MVKPEHSECLFRTEKDAGRGPDDVDTVAWQWSLKNDLRPASLRARPTRRPGEVLYLLKRALGVHSAVTLRIGFFVGQEQHGHGSYG